MRVVGRTMAVAMLAGVGLLAGGCLVGTKETECESGRMVSPATFDQVEANKTTAAWLVATLGEPTQKSKIDEHSEIWTWSGTREKTREGWIFLIFMGNDTKRTTESFYAELKDKVVVRKWRS